MAGMKKKKGKSSFSVSSFASKAAPSSSVPSPPPLPTNIQSGYDGNDFRLSEESDFDEDDLGVNIDPPVAKKAAPMAKSKIASKKAAPSKTSKKGAPQAFAQAAFPEQVQQQAAEEDDDEDDDEFLEARGRDGVAHPDKPEGPDLLGYQPYANSFVKLLSKPSLSLPLTVGIYAPWGSGKSFLMNKIKDGFVSINSVRNTPKPYFVMAHFNAWQFGGSDNIWAGLIAKLYSSIEREVGLRSSRRKVAMNAGWVRALIIRLHKLKHDLWYIGGLLILYAIIAFVFYFAYETLDNEGFFRGEAGSAGSSVTTILSLFLSLVMLTSFGASFMPALQSIKALFSHMTNARSVQMRKLTRSGTVMDKIGFLAEVKSELANMIDQVKHIRADDREVRVVLFIDDLDRCPREKAVEVLEALILLLTEDDTIAKKEDSVTYKDLPFVVFLAIDARVVAKAIEETFGAVLRESGVTGFEYLDKIVQIPFAIPSAPPEAYRHYVDAVSHGTLVSLYKDDTFRAGGFFFWEQSLREVAKDVGFPIQPQDTVEVAFVLNSSARAEITVPRADPAQSMFRVLRDEFIAQKKRSKRQQLDIKRAIIRITTAKKQIHQGLRSQSTVDDTEPVLLMFNEEGESDPLLDNKESGYEMQKLKNKRTEEDPDWKRFVELRESYLAASEIQILRSLSQAFRGNPRRTKRILNIYNIIRELPAIAQASDEVKRKAVKWVFLCEIWPYRMSWILQRVLDDHQVALMGADHAFQESDSLVRVFRDVVQYVHLAEGVSRFEGMDTMETRLRQMKQSDSGAMKPSASPTSTLLRRNSNASVSATGDVTGAPGDSEYTHRRASLLGDALGRYGGRNGTANSQHLTDWSARNATLAVENRPTGFDGDPEMFLYVLVSIGDRLSVGDVVHKLQYLAFNLNPAIRQIVERYAAREGVHVEAILRSLREDPQTDGPAQQKGGL